jgi:NhaA family Na+:H+ antiporter
MPRIGHFALEYLLALPLGAVVALAWVNLGAESYYRTTYAIAFFVNEIAMVFFFGWITKEIVEAALVPGGVLHSWRRAATPIVASVGLVIVPAVAYTAIVRLFGEPMLQQAWPVTLVTDLAFGYFAARVIFGKHAVIPFFLLVAVASDGLGFAALWLIDPLRELRPGVGLTMLSMAVALVIGLRKAGVRSFWPYVIGGGTFSWCALYFGGLHPAFALLPIVTFLPHAPRDPGFFVDAPPDAPDALNRFEVWCRHPAQIALFLFGLVNAGVPFRALEAGIWTLPVATLVFKPIGLLIGIAFALAAGLHLPRQIGWRELVVVGIISGIGFSLALFFAAATLGAGQVLSETKMGALLTVAGLGLAAGTAFLLRVGRFAGRTQRL